VVVIQPSKSKSGPINAGAEAATPIGPIGGNHGRSRARLAATASTTRPEITASFAKVTTFCRPDPSLTRHVHPGERGDGRPRDELGAARQSGRKWAQ